MNDDRTARVGSQRPGGRSERTRLAVLAATSDLLTKVGYDGLTVEAIATRAGVHRTTVYRRWPELPELVADAMAEHAGRAIPIPDTGNVAEDLRQLARAVAANLASPGQRRRAASIVAAASHSPEVAERAHAFWAARMQAARAIIQRAIDRGELSEEVDASLLVEAIVAPIWFRALATGAPITEDVLDRLVQLATSDPSPDHA